MQKYHKEADSGVSPYPIHHSETWQYVMTAASILVPYCCDEPEGQF